MATSNKQVFTTPLGVLYWPHLQKARQYKNRGAFSFDTGFGLGPAFVEALGRKTETVTAAAKRLQEEHDQFMAWVDDLMKESAELHKTPNRKPPYQPLYERDEDGEGKTEVDGATIFKFKVPEKTKTRRGEEWLRKPKLYDALGHPITGSVDVGTGTLARVKYTVYHTNGGDPELSGVRLTPVKFQIIKLVEGGAGSFEAFEDADEVAGEDAFTVDEAQQGDF